MKTIDDLLDAAAVDLQRAVVRVPVLVPASLVTDEVGVGYRRSGKGRPPSYGSRRLVVAGAALAVLVVGGLLIIERRPATQPSESPELSTSTETPTTTIPPVFDAARPPLELSSPPPGYALVGQVVRTAAGGQNLRSAVFVHRDKQGTIDGKVLARLGNFQVIGVDPFDGSLLPPDPSVFYQQPVTPPPNLSTATSSNVYIELDQRLIHVQYPLGDLGNLMLDSYHLDATTDLAVAEQMEQIAATLQLTSTAIAVSGALPAGWELAAAGAEPLTVTETYFQAFEVDTPDGGNRVFISSMTSNDAGMPYWQMDETLEPLDIRGHAGFVSTHRYPPTNTNAPPPANPTLATTLIWAEWPGHWVIVRADDMDTEQVLAFADLLTPANNGQWQLPGAPSTTTTTLSPTQTTTP